MGSDHVVAVVGYTFLFHALETLRERVRAGDITIEKAPDRELWCTTLLAGDALTNDSSVSIAIPVFALPPMIALRVEW